ncbi:MAG: ubiquinone/menaquinone biosynthesis methyltransferase [Candidatus Omnitrophica bacterium]|nr:ubiquinone/menaquinone biosynthesis methyltransferase [Candidatus Omnitrophota bacterium]
MFDALSGRYDLFNRLASLGLDQGWRRRAIAAAGLKPGWRVLDLGAGTGDLALMAAAVVAPTGVVEALDVSAPMLQRARAKAARVPAGWHVRPVQGTAERLPASDHTYDAVVSGFVMRNVSHLERTLAESHRVLRPGGRLAILEFSRPRAVLLRWGHALWLGLGTLAIGWLLTGIRGPFTYLRRSIAGFLPPEQFLARLREHGFADVAATPLLGGAVILYQGMKGGARPHQSSTGAWRQKYQVEGSHGIS